MRNLLLLAFFVTLQTILGQSYPRIIEEEENYKIIEGQIDDLPITIYLQKYKDSENIMDVYSVQGWYYYNKYAKRIPLVGVRTIDEITLYHFENKEDSECVLEMKDKEMHPQAEYEHYSGKDGFKEKFVFSTTYDGEEFNYWTTGEAHHRLYLDIENTDIWRTYYYLAFNSKDKFNLHPNSNSNWDFYRLIAHNGNRYILEYVQPSNYYVLGRCGAGEEIAFISLEFDSKNNLKMYNKNPVYSCDISFETKEEKQGNTTIYEITNDGIGYKVIVDTENASMERVNF